MAAKHVFLFAAYFVAIASGLHVKEISKDQGAETLQYGPASASGLSSESASGPASASGLTSESASGQATGPASGSTDWLVKPPVDELDGYHAATSCDPEMGPQTSKRVSGGFDLSCPSLECGALPDPEKCEVKLEYELTTDGLCCPIPCNFVLKCDKGVKARSCKIKEDECDSDKGPSFACPEPPLAECSAGSRSVHKFTFFDDSAGGRCCKTTRCAPLPKSTCDPDHGPEVGVCPNPECFNPSEDVCEVKETFEYFKNDIASHCCKKNCNFVKIGSTEKCKLTKEECNAKSGPEFNCGEIEDIECPRECKKMKGDYRFTKTMGLGSCCEDPPTCECPVDPVCDPETGPQRGKEEGGKLLSCPEATCKVPGDDCISKNEYVEHEGMCCPKLCNFVRKSDQSKPCRITKDECDKKTGPGFNCGPVDTCPCLPGTKRNITYTYNGPSSCCGLTSCEPDPSSCGLTDGPQQGLCIQKPCKNPSPEKCAKKIEYEYDKATTSCCEKQCIFKEKSPMGADDKDRTLSTKDCNIAEDECDGVTGPEFNCDEGVSVMCGPSCKAVEGKFEFKAPATDGGPASCCQATASCQCDPCTEPAKMICDILNKEPCVPDMMSSDCAGCKEGFVMPNEAGGACVPKPPCDAERRLQCANMRRLNCTEGNKECGTCQDGYFQNDGGKCEKVEVCTDTVKQTCKEKKKHACASGKAECGTCKEPLFEDDKGACKAWEDFNPTDDPASKPKGPVAAPNQVDVVFVLDTTGSMQSMITSIQTQLFDIAVTIAKMKTDPPALVRFGLVGYKDRGDIYETIGTPMTFDMDTIFKALLSFTGSGGGDTPEGLNKALMEAVHKMNWARKSDGGDENLYKVILVMSDASVHTNYRETQYGKIAADAKKMGIKINTFLTVGSITWSDPQQAARQFQEIADTTGGKYVMVQPNPANLDSTYDAELVRQYWALHGMRKPYGSEADKEQARKNIQIGEEVERLLQNRGRSSTAAARVVYEISDSKKTAMKFMEDKRDATDKDLIEDSIKNPDLVTTLSDDKLPIEYKSSSPSQRKSMVQSAITSYKATLATVTDLVEKRATQLASSKRNRHGLDAEIIKTLKTQLPGLEDVWTL